MLLLIYFLLVNSLQPMHADRAMDLCGFYVEWAPTGFCPIDGCMKCDEYESVCVTRNPLEVVPRGLDPRTKYLNLTYTGPDVELTPEMFDHLSNVESIVIVGSIASIAPNTFVKQYKLRRLTISGGSYTSVPSQLFHYSADISYLNLTNNKLREIPTNIFPQIINVSNLDLSYNELDCSANSTIASEFENLTQLSGLRLAGYGRNVEVCKNISKDYLLPLQHITVLDLSESLLFFGDQKILSTPTHLYELTINNVSPYKECPVKAEELFHNMPSNLGILSIQYWTSTNHFNESCVLTNKTLAGLKKLKRLLIFRCDYGDKLFGNVLKLGTLSAFPRLLSLSLNWCGISFIEKGTFNDIPIALEISLEGNSLGPRELELYTSDTPPGLDILNLNYAGINIDIYPASTLLQAFPTLSRLLLNGNFFKKVPNFESEHNVSLYLETLTLNDNQTEYFSMEDGEMLCKAVNALRLIELRRNQLVDVSGFSSCISLTSVYLGNNQIGKRPDSNFRALGKLFKLAVLDMSANRIQSITPELLANLSELAILILAENDIHMLAHNLLYNNPEMKCLDLSGNNLQAFNQSVVANGFANIAYLYLQFNQIADMSVELLHLFDTQLKKLQFVGLMENPLLCTCDSYLSDWVRKSPVVIQAKNLTCHPPTNPADTTQLATYKPEYFYCRVRIPLMVSGVALLCVVLSLLLALPGYKYRWYLRHPKVVARAVTEKLNEVEFDEKCQYDAFISYDTSSDSATQWIMDKLIPAIETTSSGESPTRSPQLKLYVVDRDSAVGSPKYTEKCRAIEASRKVIILLSNSYLANPTCLSEADLVAVYQMVDGEYCYQPNRILVLILEELNEQAIRSPITSLLTQNFIYIVDDEVKMKRIWRRVRRFITKPKYIYRKKTKTLTTPQPAAESEPTETDPLIQ